MVGWETKIFACFPRNFPPLVQNKSAPAPCKPFFHYMYCLPGAVRGFQMGWVKISVVVVTNQRNKNFHLLPILGFSKLTYYVNHTCRIFLWQREPTFSQVTSNDQHTPKFHQKHHFYVTIFARQPKMAPGNVKL